MPWQRLVVDVALELLPDGQPAYREVGVTVPRQSGKTTLLLAVEVHRALMWPRQPQRVYYSAQTGSDGRKKLLDDQVPILERSPLNLAIRRVYRAAGSEAVTFKTGSRIDVMASGEASGHGTTVDLGILDEAFADVDDRREQAVKPAMATKPEAQLWVTSTSGHEGSAYLKRKVATGRAAVADGLDRGMAYFEWSADQEADIGDPAVWRTCMPALGHTISEEVVAHEFHTMPEGEFRRAFCNQWTTSQERIIPAALWDAVCADDVEPDGGLVFGADAMPDRGFACIAASDSSRRAEIIAHRPGMGWVVDRCVELARRWNASIAIDTRGPLAGLIPELKARTVTVVEYGAADMAAATAALYDDIADRNLAVRQHDDLDAAVAGARKRVVGDQWYWARRDAYVDICPLVALTLAYHASVTAARSSGNLWAAWG